MKRTIYLDASVLKQSACARLFYLSLLKGYRTKLNPVVIEFGSAFHLFAKLQSQQPDQFRFNIQQAMKYLRETPSIPDTKKKYFTEGYLATVCNTWYMYHEQDSFSILKDNDGTPLVEMKFRIPFYEDEWCIIYLTGTIDKVCVHRTSKMLCVGDYKTTGMWDAEEYLKQYDLSGQLAIYTIALHHHIETATTDSVLYNYKHLNTGAFIEGIFLKGDNTCSVQKSDVRQAAEMNLEEAKWMLTNHCLRISEMVKRDEDAKRLSTNGWIPLREGIFNGACNLVFGPCKFFDYCAATSSHAAESVLQRNFITREYNPLDFSGKGEV